MYRNLVSKQRCFLDSEFQPVMEHIFSEPEERKMSDQIFTEPIEHLAECDACMHRLEMLLRDGLDPRWPSSVDSVTDDSEDEVSMVYADDLHKFDRAISDEAIIFEVHEWSLPQRVGLD